MVVGGIAFTFQIYFDFSGYSDMAIGLGKMLGFNYLENFNYPYIARTITSFWRRWHISLSTFFRDYVYIPLGGNRCKKVRHIFNLFIVWTLTGLWHGASWNFVFWGLFYFVLLVLEKFRVRTILVFILAIFACTPIFKNILDKKNKMSDIIILALFILSIVGILASSYNPFIYFRF